MPKQCCAVNCSNVFIKGSGVKFYRFPADPERKSKWVAAVNRKDWYPTEYTWICSEHFVSGAKSNHPLAPNYVPSIFKHVNSPEKRRLEAKVAGFQRRTAVRKRRIEETEKSFIAEEQRKKRLCEEKENRRLEEIAEQKRSEEEMRVKELELQKRLEFEKRKQEEVQRLRKQEEAERLRKEEEKKRLEEARARKIIQDVEQKK